MAAQPKKTGSKKVAPMKAKKAAGAGKRSTAKTAKRKPVSKQAATKTKQKKATKPKKAEGTSTKKAATKKPPAVAKKVGKTTAGSKAKKGAQEVYYTHDNGGRPFKVAVVPEPTDGLSTVAVYPRTGWNARQRDVYADSPKVEFSTQEVFVGIDPTEPKFKGNTILLSHQSGLATYIGERVMQFTPAAPITRYSSPVGNSDVPYPYAVDEKGGYYLMIEGVRLSSLPSDEKDIDPYDFYYSAKGRKRSSKIKCKEIVAQL